jgi:hypothetical protein
MVGLFFSACTKKAVKATTPTDAVESFIKLSSSSESKEDKKKLMSLCRGPLLKAFEKMSEDVFQISYLSGNINVKQIQIIDSKTDESIATVVYRVLVDNQQGSEATEESNEREVDLVKNEGNWYLYSIRPKGSDKIAFTKGMLF